MTEDRPLSHQIALRIDKCIEERLGLLVPRRGVAVPIHVSAEQLPRALRICDALLAAIQEANHPSLGQRERSSQSGEAAPITATSAQSGTAPSVPDGMSAAVSQ